VDFIGHACRVKDFFDQRVKDVEQKHIKANNACMHAVKVKIYHMHGWVQKLVKDNFGETTSQR
jgi:hypothetical protein